jgi:hypothetical protein
MTQHTWLLADRELRDLIAQLASASEALFDTHGLLNDGDPDSVAIVTMDNINVARAALEAAATFLHALRFAEDSVRASELNR